MTEGCRHFFRLVGRLKLTRAFTGAHDDVIHEAGGCGSNASEEHSAAACPIGGGRGEV
jgi:hypothetical protein